LWIAFIKCYGLRCIFAINKVPPIITPKQHRARAPPIIRPLGFNPPLTVQRDEARNKSAATITTRARKIVAIMFMFSRKRCSKQAPSRLPKQISTHASNVTSAVRQLSAATGQHPWNSTAGPEDRPTEFLQVRERLLDTAL
jgi:hypothetical protein